MSDLHERLLAEIARYEGAMGTRTLCAALRAVVELHAPVPCQRFSPCSLRHEHLTCGVCGGEQPCREMRVIAGQLGIPVEDEELERIEKEERRG